MPNVPVLKTKQVIAAFERLGWTVARQRGSHIIMTKHGQIASLSIPSLSEVARGTLRSLISKAEITIDDFLEALQK